MSKDTRRSVLVEQRVKESEAGKAKTHDAKLQVQNLVNQKACGLRLPAEAGKFISEVWTRVLTLRMVKHGQNHESWRDGVAVLDDLLWVLQPLSESEQIEQRDAKAPALLSAVSAGMVQLGCPEDEITQFDQWLSSHLENLSDNDRAYLSDDERPELAIEETLVEEIVLASPIIEVDENAIDKSVAEQLKLLTEGSWVEIAEEDRKLRCKLATITQPGDKYIFVNRRGMKVLEKNKLELVELLKQDDLKRIDESQVFDRALQSVIGNLRQMQRKRTQ